MGGDMGWEYSLYGAVNHFGTVSSGHYTAFCKVGPQWVSFNDSHVSVVSDISKTMLAESGYVLFYKLRETKFSL